MSNSILVIPRDIITNLSSFEDETGDRYYEIPAHLLDEYTQDTTELLEKLSRAKGICNFFSKKYFNDHTSDLEMAKSEIRDVIKALGGQGN